MPNTEAAAAEQATAEQAEPMSAVLAVHLYMGEAVAEVRHDLVLLLEVSGVFGVHTPLAVAMQVRATLCPLVIPVNLVGGMVVLVLLREVAVS